MSDLEIYIFLAVLFSIPFIFGAIVLPKEKDKEKAAPAPPPEPAPEAEPRRIAVYLPPLPRPCQPRPHRHVYEAGAAVTGAAMMGSWHSDFSSSPFRGADIGMEDITFPAFLGSDEDSFSTGSGLIDDDLNPGLPGGGFVDLVHGGIDPTGQGGMAGDFNPDHHNDMFSHSDPFDSGFITDSFSTDSFSHDSFGTDSIGCDSFGSSFGCGFDD